ncbi:hypothetical protein D3C85_1384830 [compost metagenome]
MEGLQHPPLELPPRLAAQEGRALLIGQQVGLADLRVQGLGRDLAQAAGADLAQTGQFLDRQAAPAQQLIEGLPGARIVRAHRAVDRQVGEDLAERPRLAHALGRQRHAARVERPAGGIEIAHMTVPDQIAAAPAQRPRTDISHGPPPWDC